MMKKRYLITGLLTAIPLWITWLVVRFIFGLVTDAGMPFVNWTTKLTRPNHPMIAEIIQHPIFKSIISIILILLFLYFLGWLTTRVLGRKLIKKIERLLDKIPMVRTVYGGSKKILESFKIRYRFYG